MYHIHYLNKISPKGTALWSEEYAPVEEIQDAEAVLVRSASIHDMEMPEKLLHGQRKMDFPQASEEDISSAMFRSGGFLGQAREILKEGGALPPQTQDFVRSFCNRDSLGLTQVLVPLEKWKRDALMELLGQWQQLLEQALACRSGSAAASAPARAIAQSRRSGEILTALKHVAKASEYCAANVSTAAVCGWLSWALR